MKNCKKYIMVALALLPLIMVLLPYLISFGAEDRTPVPKLADLNLYTYNDSAGNIAGYVINGFGTEDSFSKVLSMVFLGEPTATLTINKSRYPVAYAICGLIDILQKSTGMVNATYIIFAAFYMMYLFSLEMIFMMLNVITWIPTRISEMIMR